MKRLIITLALVLAFPLATAAQQHGQMHRQQQGMQGMHQGMGMQMMGGMHGMMMARPGPGMLLRLQGTLELTEDQVEELEAMHTEAREAMETHREAAQEARARAHEAMMGDSQDLDAFQSALEEAAQHNVQAMLAMARVHAEAAEVLDEDQRVMLETLQAAMQEMHEGREMDRPTDEMHGEGMEHRMQGHEGIR